MRHIILLDMKDMADLFNGKDVELPEIEPKIFVRLDPDSFVTADSQEEPTQEDQ